MNILDIDKDKQGDLGQDEQVDVSELSRELQAAVADASQFIETCGDAYDTRWCIWPGQSDSGRKEANAIGRDPFPFEGASDTRIRLADEVCNDEATMLVAAVSRARIQAVPIESMDSVEAGAVTTFLQWLRKNIMAENIRTEVPLLANWQEMYAHSILAVSWDQEVRLAFVPTTLADLQAHTAAGLQSGDMHALYWKEMLQAVFDEEREEEVAVWLRTLNPVMTKRQAEAAVRALRTEGMFEAPRPNVTRNQPCWTALRPFRDCFYPANTTDLSRARWIALREVLSPGDLRSRVLLEDYDDAAVEEAITNHLGTSILDGVTLENTTKMTVVDEMKGMVETFCFYRRQTDEDGYTTIQICEFSPGVKEPFKEYESDYAHREYPFIDFVRNRTERLLLENRGVPDLCTTQQQEVKTQRDYRADSSSMRIMPPVEVPMQRPNLKLTFGPAKQIPVRRAGENAFMKIPPADADTVAIEQQTRLDVDNYFSRWKEGVHPTRQNLNSQRLVDEWLGGFRKVFKQTLMLCRQYMGDEEFARITGVRIPFSLDEDTIMKQYDVMLEFSAADLNTEVVVQKLKLINEAVLPGDTMGVVNRVGLTEWAMRSIDPSLAERLITSPQAASNQEIEDEQVQFSKLFAGTEPEMKQQGENAALRLQTLQTIVQRNPNVQNRYANDEIFRKMMDARVQHFTFLLQQQQNAQIGRVGAAPALGGPAQEAAAGGMQLGAAGGGPNGSAAPAQAMGAGYEQEAAA